MPKPLIDAATLAERLASGAPTTLLDASFDLADPAAGERAWAAGHLPGALYLHLDRDLADHAPAPDGRFRGRHPLPAREAFAATLGRFGVGPATAVVVHDRQGGVYAARAWWMLRWLGHAEVAVLDGGVAAWTAAGHPLSSEPPPAPTPAAPYPAGASLVASIDADALGARLGTLRLIDARAPERFRGEVEPLDPIAGHIPGALNRPFKDNLDAQGRFLPPDALRAAFVPLLGGAPAADVVHQCGSGVTACHNLLAMDAAGLAGSALYPGSWSEWCADATRPIAIG
ncbi:MAG TPA: sulfurtransferase [Methylibium sp.]|uniref:sulfurtransferase n=1 Tax=Methylibium sp. TaxID=2067992 RepID=UPI002DBD8F29|nr:sulfurtransferase [Methylibium sp.]HEU4459780.1 sulfurtransferase [Methylibium sp.]